MANAISFKALQEGETISTAFGMVTIVRKVSAHTEYKGSQAYLIYSYEGVEAKATMSAFCKRFALTNEGSTFVGSSSGKRLRVLTEEEVEAKVEAYRLKVAQALNTLKTLKFEAEVEALEAEVEAKVEAYRNSVLAEVLEAKAKAEALEAEAKAKAEAKALEALKALRALGLTAEALEALLDK